jgi:hypothetical protein
LVAEIAARSSFDTPATAAVWREAERRLEDRASTRARAGLAPLRTNRLHSRIAYTTIMVIEFH